MQTIATIGLDIAKSVFRGRNFQGSRTWIPSTMP
jgi:hypothetical protein